VSLSLFDLGWSDARAAAFDPLAASGLVPGRVALEHNHVFRVLTEGGELLAEVAGALKHRATTRVDLPVVGDWVGVRRDPAGARSQIREVLPRKTRVSRRAAGRDTVEQVVAANIDTLFIVFGLDSPVNPRAIDRYLVVGRHSGATLVVLFNKADLLDAPEEAAALLRAHAPGVDVRTVSARTAEGLAPLETWLGPGQTVALVGPSGVGKSSLVNRLIGREVLPTGEVREWDHRGRHTSVHRQLVVREHGGLVIDTPGMREVALWEADAVDDAFTDIAQVAAACRFRDCRHRSEPGCAVKAAVDAGQIDGGRYESYLTLQQEQEEIEQRRQERERIEERRGAKQQRSRPAPARGKSRQQG
jgi:ribosome biogenesis GTPase